MSAGKQPVARGNAPPQPVNPLTPGPLPRTSNATPLTIRPIIKLDQHSMVWARDGIATQVESLGPFIALVFSIFVIGFIWMAFASEGYSSAGTGTAITLMVATVVFSVIGVGGAVYFLKISVFNTYGDLHFNRKTGKIYTAEAGEPIIMDWRHVHPEAVLTVGPIQMGAPPVMSLTLVETFPDNPQAWKTRLAVAGPLPNREGCQQVWELIRRYMDDPPETMPELEVVPGSQSWTDVLLTSGPMSRFGPEGSEFVKRLRQNHWKVFINPIHFLIWFAGWPFALSDTLYAKYRRKTRLPAEWTREETPPAGEESPYACGAMNPEEAAGRRHAARVIGLSSGICVVLGIAVTAWVLWLLFGDMFY